MSEFSKIHVSIFGFETNDLNFAKQYQKAIQELLTDQTSVKHVKIEKALSSNLDLEAIEYFLRLRHGKNTLTQSFHIITYLAESRARYYPYFINETDAFWRAGILMTWWSLRSIMKIAKGYYLTTRYSLV